MSASSPRHSPPPSAAAPRPKGILKNASADALANEQRRPSAQSLTSADAVDEHGNRLAWDETNLTLHEIERENQAARMKIDEPKTPFVRSASLGPMDDDSISFNLDGQQQQQQQQQQQPASYFTTGAASGEPSASGSRTSSRRSSAAEQLAANTIANAGRRPSTGSSSGDGATLAPTAAVGMDSVDMALTGSPNSALKRSGDRRGSSRSPSFTLPPSGSRRSSSAAAQVADRSREGIRQEVKDRDDAMQGLEGEGEGEEALDDEDNNLDPEAKAKQDEFNRKRNAHYGNEAEAMKIAAALAAQEDDEDDEDEDDEPQSIPPVPPLPNGSA